MQVNTTFGVLNSLKGVLQIFRMFQIIHFKAGLKIFMRYSCLLWAFIAFPRLIFAQNLTHLDQYKQYDASYGMDEVLFNGKRYFDDTDRPYGSPFLSLPSNDDASVIIDGKTFHHQRILYDCYKQHFVLAFKSTAGFENRIILQNHLIDTIKFGQHVFVKNMHNEINNSFVQLIHEVPFPVYFSWKKEKIFKTAGENAGYYFTREQREVYCVKEAVVFRIQSRKHFINLFPKADQALVRNELKNEKLSFRKVKAPDLMDFLINLNESLEK